MCEENNPLLVPFAWEGEFVQPARRSFLVYADRGGNPNINWALRVGI